MTWAPCPHGVRTRGGAGSRNHWHSPKSEPFGLIELLKFVKGIGLGICPWPCFTFPCLRIARSCVQPAISSWTHFKSDGLLDGWQPRASCASQRVTWEDHSPMLGMSNIRIVKTCMPLASFQKEAKGASSRTSPKGKASKAARQTLHSRNGSSPRAKQDMLHGRRMKAGDLTRCKKCRNWKSDYIFQTRPGMMRPIHAGPREIGETE